MPLSYQERFRINQFECDRWDRMKPAAALRRIQEIATNQLEVLGFYTPYNGRPDSVFLLSKISMQINRMPAFGEHVMLETRAYGMRRAVFQRMTSFHAMNGEKLCETDARWMLVDTRTNRIMREPQEYSRSFNDEQGAETHPMVMPKPGEPTRLTDMTARYSLCDRNGHINNADYADLMCDHLPLEKLEQSAPRRMLFFYRAEIRLGETFHLSTAPIGQNGHYFMAGIGDKKHFEGTVEF
ncbi:MAG: hypothetical protein GXY32_04970 [Ruminococcaceae bacterium]|nr:hypothetical protein [Oscillospiraceae bacterium]